MTDEAKPLTADDICKMTPEERLRLAESMATPLRCGGTDYVDGKLHYRIQGWLVPEGVIEQSKQEHNGDPWPGIKAYQEAHTPYPISIGRRASKTWKSSQ